MTRPTTFVTLFLALLLIVGLLAACGREPGPEAPAGMTKVVLSAQEALAMVPQGVPMQEGISVVQHFAITVHDEDGHTVTFDAANVFDPDGDVTVLTLGAGASTVTVMLPPGRYTFRTTGSETPGGPPIAYGETVRDVSHATETVSLDVHTLLGEAELLPAAPRNFIKPGEVLDLYLVVRTASGSYRVPIADFTAEYQLDAALGDLLGSKVGARVHVTTAPTQDHFVVTVTVRGWGLVEGVPTSGHEITATFERPFLHAGGITLDVEPPSLLFPQPAEVHAGQTVTLSGTALDDVGIDRVLVFEGPVLIGSSASEDVLGEVEPITFTDTDTGAWTMEWRPPTAGAYALTAIAIDTSGNEAQVAIELVVGAGAPPPASIGELRSLSGGEPLDESLGNCAANELGLPGQGLQAVGAGLQAVGAVGGLFVGPSASFAGRLTTTSKVAGEVTGVAGAGHYHRRVAVLVVDEFDGVYALPSQLTSGDPVTAEEVALLAANGDLTHGALVLHHLLGLLQGSGHGPAVQGVNGSTGEPLYSFGHGYVGEVVLQTVDTAGRDTAAIVAAIRGSLEYLSRVGELGFTDFVVNMSFAVVPCAVAADLGASSVTTFDEYVAAVRLVNGIGAQYDEGLAELLTTPLGAEDDPLLAYLDCPLPAEKYGLPRCDGGWQNGGYVLGSLVHVASSGNLGHGFALYPAAWPTVISVSSLDASGAGYSPSRSSFANSGEVAAPGALFELGAAGAGQTIAYAGTSFSAPVVTLFAALDRLADRVCDPGDLTATPAAAPSLASGTYDDTPLDSVFGGAGSAIDLRCTP